MIVYDLRCRDDHRFEGWFGSSDDFSDQKQRGLLQCPLCGSLEITKAVMAPYIGAKANSTNAVSDPKESSENSINGMFGGSAGKSKMTEIVDLEVIKQIAKLQTTLLEKSKWVGEDFTNRAREIHYGERSGEQIHGVASPTQVEEMHEEGISILPLPLPVIPPEAKN